MSPNPLLSGLAGAAGSTRGELAAAVGLPRCTALAAQGGALPALLTAGLPGALPLCQALLAQAEGLCAEIRWGDVAPDTLEWEASRTPLPDGGEVVQVGGPIPREAYVVVLVRGAAGGVSRFSLATPEQPSGLITVIMEAGGGCAVHLADPQGQALPAVFRLTPTGQVRPGEEPTDFGAALDEAGQRLARGSEGGPQRGPDADAPAGDPLARLFPDLSGGAGGVGGSGGLGGAGGAGAAGGVGLASALGLVFKRHLAEAVLGSHCPPPVLGPRPGATPGTPPVLGPRPAATPVPPPLGPGPAPRPEMQRLPLGAEPAAWPGPGYRPSPGGPGAAPPSPPAPVSALAPVPVPGHAPAPKPAPASPQPAPRPGPGPRSEPTSGGTEATPGLTLVDAKGGERLLTRFPCTIGRLPENDLCVDHGSVSRRHGRFESDDEGFWIIDGGSANGTFLGDRRLTRDQRERLTDGVRLRLADVIFTVRLPPDASHAATVVLSADRLARALAAQPAPTSATPDMPIVRGDAPGGAAAAPAPTPPLAPVPTPQPPVPTPQPPVPTPQPPVPTPQPPVPTPQPPVPPGSPPAATPATPPPAPAAPLGASPPPTPASPPIPGEPAASPTPEGPPGGPPAGAAPPRFCTQCGGSRDPAARFCRHCGRPF